MKVSEIRKMPTLHENIHESIFRSFQTLQHVKYMLKRKDSVETISDVIEFIEHKEQ